MNGRLNLAELSSDNPTVRKIVKTNVNYYTNKWQKHKNPFKFCGWNWAAFFVPPFWLAYRHMYGWAALFFLLYLPAMAVNGVIPALSYSGYLPDNTLFVWNTAFPILISTFLGIKGNAFYSKRAAKLIKLQKSGSEQKVAPLFSAEGSSFVSAFAAPAILLILLFIPYQTVNNWEYNPDLPYGVYVFSDDRPAPEGILDVEQSPSFAKYSARINFTYLGEEPVGDRPFAVKLYYRSGEAGDWSLERERSYHIFSSSRVTLDLIDAEDPASQTGRYRVEIYVGDELKEEEEFTITDPV